ERRKLDHHVAAFAVHRTDIAERLRDQPFAHQPQIRGTDFFSQYLKHAVIIARGYPSRKRL
ncbi:MAG: hypothetical protein KGY81_08200, partial [Phycisphaerae bacterium]|nr:hypothetical protein [Phycisphaerae bacterium]